MFSDLVVAVFSCKCPLAVGRIVSSTDDVLGHEAENTHMHTPHPSEI